MILILGLILFFTLVPGYIDQNVNRLEEIGIGSVSEEARQLHQTLLVADLHNDLLLWDRDPLKRTARGHTDIPRLLDGKVGLQIFSAVIKTPRGLNYESNPADSDMLTPLLVAQRWPVGTWFDLTERALYQAEKFRRAASESEGRLVLLNYKSDLERFSQAGNALSVGGILAIEGLHALEGKLENVDRLYEAGYRMMGLTHFFDNEVAGSAHGLEKKGLTPLGRSVVHRMEQLGIIIDLAHASEQTVSEVLDRVTRPVVVSHTGVQATCEGLRNLTDDQVRRIAGVEGLIGIGFWDGAVCGVHPNAIARAMRHVADLVGVEHVALGSDYDGAITVAFDAANMVHLTQALLQANFTPEEVKQIMGGNAQRFLQKALPEAPLH